jgi:hypothetical protein
MNIILHRHMAGLLLEINGKETKPNYTQHTTSWLNKLFSLPCHSLFLLAHKQKETLKLIHCITVYFKCYTDTNTILVCLQGPYCPLTYVHHASINSYHQGGIYGSTRGYSQGLHNPISSNTNLLA